MDERKSNDVMKKNEDANLVEQLRAKLHWYTMEASEEEFDVEEVDLLVEMIRRMEEKPENSKLENEEALQALRNYRDMRMNVEAQGSEKDGQRLFSKKEGIFRFRRRSLLAVAVVACLLLVISMASFLGTTNANDDTGFFHWLRKDEEGATFVTSPDDVEAVNGKQVVTEYFVKEDIPEKYKQYVVEKGSIKLLEEYEWSSFSVRTSYVSERLSTVFESKESGEKIELGVMIYQDNIVIAKESLAGYELYETNLVEGREQDVFKKVNKEGTKEYCVFFYIDNMRYFVFGQEDIGFLKNVSEEYMEVVLNNKE